MTIRLPKNPAEAQYEDLVCACLLCLGYFVEPRIKLREGGVEVLEMDVVATPSNFDYLTHLALMLDELNRLKVPLITSSQGIDTSDDNPAGRLQLGVLMAVAEFERGIIRERVNAGVAAAKERGVQLGRPPTLEARAPEVLKLKAQGKGIRAIARSLKMPVSSVHSIIKYSQRGWAAMKETVAKAAEV